MAKNNLFDLILSMEEVEKKRFHAFANRFNRMPGYLKLFHLIVDNPGIAENRLKRISKLSSKKFSQVKYELKTELWSFLEIATSSSRNELYRSISLIDELYRRNQLNLLVQELRKAKSNAKRIEAVELLEILLQREETLPPNFRTSSFQSDRDWISIFRENFNAIDHLHELMKQSLTQESKASVRRNIVQDLLDRPILQEPPKSIRSRERWLRIQLNGQKFLGNWPLVIQFISQYKELLEGSKQVFEDAFMLMIRQVYILPYLFDQLGDSKGRTKSLLEISQISTQNAFEKAMRDTAYFLPILTQALHSGDFSYFEKQKSFFLPQFTKNIHLLPATFRSQVRFNLAKFFFFKHDWLNAIKFTEEILNDTENNPAKDQYLPFSYTIQLLSGVEAGREGVTDTTLRSFKKYLKSQENRFQYFQTVLNMVNRYASAFPFDRINIIEDSICELDIISSNPKEKRPFDFLNLTPWLKSITTGQSTSFYLQEAFRAQESKAQFRTKLP